MSYCRWGGNSDVYVFHNSDNYIECCGCYIDPSRAFWTKSRTAMIEHLRQHEAAGGRVPEWLIPDLQSEIESIGDAVTDQIGACA